MEGHDGVTLSHMEKPAGRTEGPDKTFEDADGVRKTIQGGFNRVLLLRAARDAFFKLNPRFLWTNPVIFVVEVVAFLTTFFTIRDAVVGKTATLWFDSQISAWLWIT
ncbi:MAG: hypothetical protein ACPLUI_14260, partial [Desulfofundulus sp.]